MKYTPEKAYRQYPYPLGELVFCHHRRHIRCHS